jgi:hypothetical protein
MNQFSFFIRNPYGLYGRRVQACELMQLASGGNRKAFSFLPTKEREPHPDTIRWLSKVYFLIATFTQKSSMITYVEYTSENNKRKKFWTRLYLLNKLLVGNYVKQEKKYVIKAGKSFLGFMTILSFKTFQQLHQCTKKRKLWDDQARTCENRLDQWRRCDARDLLQTHETCAFVTNKDEMLACFRHIIRNCIYAITLSSILFK